MSERQRVSLESHIVDPNTRYTCPACVACPLMHLSDFRRGWTLQEIIAPQNLAFYSRTWQFRGFRADLAPRLAQYTKIPVQILVKPSRSALRSQSVARRLSWASSRTTTRPEDRSYCLFGLFDLSMPILYGEGASKAFWRLQSEIFRTTADHSIFAWRCHPKFVYPPTTNLFALDPSCFWKSSDVVPCRYTSVVPHKELAHKKQISLDSEFSSFSHGLHIQFLVSFEGHGDSRDISQGRGVDKWHSTCLLACSDPRNPGSLFAINIISPEPGQIIRRSLQDPRLYDASDISSLYQADFFLTPSSFTDEPLNRLPRAARLLTPQSNLRVLVYDGSALASGFSRSTTSPATPLEASSHWQADQSVETLPGLRAVYTESARGLSFNMHFKIKLNETMNNPGYEDAQLKFLLEIVFGLSDNKDKPGGSSIKTEAVGILKKTTVIELRSETHFRPHFILWPTFYWTYDAEDETGVLNIYLRLVTTNRERSFPSQQQRSQASRPPRTKESSKLFTRRLTYDHK